jgi:hypothetical protein
MRLNVLLVALLTTAACVAKSPVAPSQGPWRFSGTVLATDGVRIGGPIAGAVLTVVSGVNSNRKVTSDGAGHFAFAALETDTFTVTVAASGYVSATPVINLYRDIDADFALKPR